jgi:hypothetical protein
MHHGESGSLEGAAAGSQRLDLLTQFLNLVRPAAHGLVLYKSRYASRKIALICHLLVQHFILYISDLGRTFQPGGLGVGSSNLPAPTNEINGYWRFRSARPSGRFAAERPHGRAGALGDSRAETGGPGTRAWGSACRVRVGVRSRQWTTRSSPSWLSATAVQLSTQSPQLR